MGNRNAGRFSRRQWDPSPFLGWAVFLRKVEFGAALGFHAVAFLAVGRMGKLQRDAGFVGNFVENPGIGLHPFGLTLMHLTFFEARP
jgi:hypothetical protein